MAEEKAKTEAALRALDAEKARLQQQREWRAAHANEESEGRASAATVVAMEEAGRKVCRETPPGGSRVDTLRRFFDGDPVSRIRVDLDAEDSQSRKGSAPPPDPAKRARGRPQNDHGGWPRSTPTTPNPSSPAAMGMDKAAGLATSPGVARWEWPEPVVEEGTTPP